MKKVQGNLYSLDCKENHMKNQSFICVCMLASRVKRTSILQTHNSDQS